MPRFLILKLDGPMQAWGTHTYEDYRPSNYFPTRSGLLGILGACLGIDRRDNEQLERLSQSVEFTVRADQYVRRKENGRTMQKSMTKLPDYHTIIEARRANRFPKKDETVQSIREYLYDASFTVAIKERLDASITLDMISAALQKPVYTPSLGRRSCPIARPLFETFVEAEIAKEALNRIPIATDGVIYAESENNHAVRRVLLRDVPMWGGVRRFGTRFVYIIGDGGEDNHVS